MFKIYHAQLMALIYSTMTQVGDHPIYCQGPILNAIQTQGIFKDSKEFVDMPMKYPQNQILDSWNIIDPKNKDQVIKFVQDNFLPAGSDSEQVIPSDWTQTPPFLVNIVDPLLRQWGSDVNQIWKMLSKKFVMNETQSSVLSCPFPFIIAGGRFREFYYWDSLWITEGLLLSGMRDSALNMLRNFAHFINKYGYVPNGARVYFLGRSQPPVTSQMAELIFENMREKGEFQNAYNLVKEIFISLEKEHQFWLDNRSILAADLFSDLTLGDILLFHYDGVGTPRPESYKEDIVFAQSHDNVKSIYRNIWAACESGLDFSSRWFKDVNDMSTIRTTDIIPMDLNIFISQTEIILSKFASHLELNQKADYYAKQSQDRVNLINDKFYNKDMGQWNDYIISEKQLNQQYYPSNFFPLQLLPIDSPLYPQIRAQIKILIDLHPGGIPQSFVDNKQQWDFPNSWAPFNHMIVKGLQRHNDTELALKLAQNWITNNYCSFQNAKVQYGEGYMFEKYDSENIGKEGGGGEYDIQKGFGWTNGVVISFLSKYGKDLYAEVKC